MRGLRPLKHLLKHFLKHPLKRLAIGAMAALALPGAICHGTEAPLTLGAAVARALADNPSLQREPHLLAAQRGRLAQAALRPKPELTLEVENFLGTGDFGDANATETTLSIAWVLERGKREHRRAVAAAGIDDTSVALRLERLEVAAATASAFLAVLREQERLRQAEEAVLLAGRAVTAARARVNVARSPAADLSRAEADLAWLELEREDVEHELAVARRKLAARWGAPLLKADRVAGDLAAVPHAGTYAELVAAVAESPGIQRYLTTGRIRQAELALAEANARSSWTFSAGARHLKLPDDSAFVATITMPVGRNRNQGNIASARARAALTAVEKEATRINIETTLYGLHQALTHNLHRAEGMRTNVLPRVEAVLADAERAYERGRFSYLELREAQLNLLGTRAALLEEHYQAHLNRTAIERLTGTLVPDAATAEEAGS